MTLASAQTPASVADRAVLERQQQHEELVLRMRQFQALSNPALTPDQRQSLGARQFSERLDQDRLHTDQMRRHEVLEQAVLPRLPESQQQLQFDLEKAEFGRERAAP